MYTLRQELGSGVERILFPDGPSLLLRRKEGLPVVAGRCYVRGGSIAESPGGAGVAHLLEHVIGTVAAERVSHGGAGAHFQASTTREYTCYAWTVQARDGAALLRGFLAACLDRDSLAAVFAAQREVVLEEIRLFAEQKVRLLQQCFLEQAFATHPVRYPVCGRAPRVRNLTMAGLEDYRGRLYAGPNVRIVLVGEVDVDRAVDAVAEASEGFAGGPWFELGEEAREAGNAASATFELDGEDPGEGCSLVGFRTVGSDSDDGPALEALADEINGGPSCELRHELVTGGLARHLTARSVHTAFGAGYFYVLARRAERNRAAVEEKILGWLRRVGTGAALVRPSAAPGTDDLRRECPGLADLAACLGHGDARSGDPFEVSELRRRAARAGTLEISEAAARYCREERAIVGHLRSRRRRRNASRLRSKVPEPRQGRLPNGVRFLVEPVPGAGASCQVLGRGGVLSESETDNGLCALMAELLPESLRDARRERMESCRSISGADFYSFCDESLFGLSVTVPGRDLTAGLELVADMVLRPSFEARAVAAHRDRTLAWLKRCSRASEPWEGHQDLKRLLYRQHPYRMTETGTPESVRSLSLADVTACHERLCVGENLAVAVIGDVAPDAVSEKVAELFEAASPAALEGCPPAPEPARQTPELAVVERGGEQGALALGYSGVPWQRGDWCALEVLTALLAGEGSATGRLVRALRVHGTAYSVACFDHAGFGEGYYELLARFTPRKEAAATEAILAEIERLRQGEVTPLELESSRKLCLLNHLLRYESPRRQAYFAARHVLLAGDAAEWLESARRLAAVRLDEVVAAARRCFREARRGIVALRPRKRR